MEVILEIKNIVVDLDGTLIHVDSSFKLWKLLFKSNFALFMKVILIYLFYGEASSKNALAKNELAKNALNATENFGYELNVKLFEYLARMKAQGYHIVLATGSNIKIAQLLNKKYELFDQIIASDQKMNCIGINKLEAIKKLLGSAEFIYIGDHWYDFPVWHEAQAIGVVRPNKMLLQCLQNHCNKNNKTFLVFD